LTLLEPGEVDPEVEVTDIGIEEFVTPIVDEGEVIIPISEVVADDEGGVSYFWLVFILLLLGGVGAVVFVVVRTIRQRQEELDVAPKAPEGGSEGTASEVVEPEVVEPEVAVPEAPAPEQPIEEKKDPASSSSETSQRSDSSGPKDPPVDSAGGGDVGGSVKSFRSVRNLDLN